MLGKEKTSYPNLGVREGFLEETVLELLGKSMWESERTRGFQAELAAQEREWASLHAVTSAWLEPDTGCMGKVRGDAGAEATSSGGRQEALRVLNNGVS